MLDTVAHTPGAVATTAPAPRRQPSATTRPSPVPGRWRSSPPSSPRTSSGAPRPRRTAPPRRGARPLRRPPCPHLRARRHVRAQRRRARRLPGRRDAAPDRQRPSGLGRHRLRRRQGILILFAVSPASEQALSVVANQAQSGPRRRRVRCGPCTTACSPCCTWRSPWPCWVCPAPASRRASRRVRLRLARPGRIRPARHLLCRRALHGRRRPGRRVRTRRCIGFLIWLAFLPATGFRLVRTTRSHRDHRHGPHHDQTDPSSPPRSSRRWNAPGTAPTARRTAKCSPPTPTSSTSAARITRPNRHRRRPPNIFDTIYAGSTVHYELDSGPHRQPGCIVAVVTSTLDAPSGPLQGINHARITPPSRDHDGRWQSPPSTTPCSHRRADAATDRSSRKQPSCTASTRPLPHCPPTSAE